MAAPDPWARFRDEPAATADPWAQFRDKPTYTGPTYGTPEPEPSAFDRFMSGVGQYLNPVKVIRDMGEATRPVNVPAEFGQAVEAFRGGDYGQAARHAATAAAPLVSPALVPAAKMAQATADASSGQLIKAYDAAAAGEYGKAIGHGLGAVPIVGPMGAAAGERINSGDWAGGTGEMLGALGSVYLPVGAAKAAPAAGRAAAATGRAVGRAARTVASKADLGAGATLGSTTLWATGNPVAATVAAGGAALGAPPLKALASGRGVEMVREVLSRRAAAKAAAEASKVRSSTSWPASGSAVDTRYTPPAAAVAPEAPPVLLVESPASTTAAPIRPIPPGARPPAAQVAPEAAPAPAAWAGVDPETATLLQRAEARGMGGPRPAPAPVAAEAPAAVPEAAPAAGPVTPNGTSVATLESRIVDWRRKGLSAGQITDILYEQERIPRGAGRRMADMVLEANGLAERVPGPIRVVPPRAGAAQVVDDSLVNPDSPGNIFNRAPSEPAPPPRAPGAEAVAQANAVESKIVELRKAGLSGAQITASLRELFKIPPSDGQRMVNMVFQAYGLAK